MTMRVWRTSVVAILLIVIMYVLGIAHSRAIPRLRSQHSQPAARIPSQQVAVTADGKTFHRVDCPFVHGPVKMVDAKTAAQQGYVPDPRCMQKALQK